MFQRSGANASIRSASYQQLHSATITDFEMPESISLTSQGARSTLTKKLLLTLFVLVQVCFISCLWLMQLGGGLNPSIDEVTVQSTKRLAVSNNVKNMSLIGRLHAMRRVNFVRKTSTYKPTEKSTRKEFSTHALSPAVIKNSQSSGNVSNFRKDFYLKLNRLNTSIEFRNRNGLVPELDNDTLWCFREGSIDEKSQSTNVDIEQDLPISWEEENMQCKCRAGWHGRDCGQPEVMWRALLTTKSHFKLQKPSETKNPNKLVYLLEGNFFNLDLLDLQISTLADIVDYFVIYIRPTQKDLKQLKRSVKETLKTNNYFIFHCDQKLALKNENCTTHYVYRYFRQQLKNKKLHFTPLKPTDLLLYTDDRVLPSRQALKFLKYYATDVSITPFRLKYVVYGFYWLHPKQTYISGFISSFVHMDNSNKRDDDNAPAHFQQLFAGESERSLTFVIGDLNHFGGWFCRYCQQPEDIIAELHAETSSSKQVQFPAAERNHNIDVAYLQKLIANGIDVDGKTQLLRNRRYSDIYYAPAIAEKESSKFGNLLVNLYETFDDDIEYEAGDY